MSHYLFSLPSTWTYVQGSGGDCGTECRKADGVVYSAERSFLSDAKVNAFARRDAARHARREERRHIDEQLEAYAEVYERKYARDAQQYRLERIDREVFDLMDEVHEELNVVGREFGQERRELRRLEELLEEAYKARYDVLYARLRTLRELAGDLG